MPQLFDYSSQEVLNRVFDAANNRLNVFPQIRDDQLLLLGNDSDIALLLRSTALAANTALTGVLVGTPVTPIGPAANSLIIGNITASGDILIAVNKGGTSYMAFMADASTGDTLVGVPTGASFDVYIAGVKQIDYAAGAMAFQQATTISTTGQLTINGTTAVVFNEASADIDFRIESDGNASMFVVDAGENTVTIGGTPSTTYGKWLEIQGHALTVDVNETFDRVIVGAAIALTTAASGTHSRISSVTVNEPNITIGTAGVTNAVSLYIAGAPTEASTGNYALWVGAGISKFDGQVLIGLTAGANVTGNSILSSGGIAFTDVANAWIDDATHGDGTTPLYIGNAVIGVLSVAQSFSALQTFNAGIAIADAQNIVLSTTTGTKIGTAAAQKLGLWGAVPVVQAALTAAAPAGGTGATAGAWDSAANRDIAITTINAMRTALINAGIMAAA